MGFNNNSAIYCLFKMLIMKLFMVQFLVAALLILYTFATPLSEESRWSMVGPPLDYTPDGYLPPCGTWKVREGYTCQACSCDCYCNAVYTFGAIDCEDINQSSSTTCCYDYTGRYPKDPKEYDPNVYVTCERVGKPLVYPN